MVQLASSYRLSIKTMLLPAAVWFHLKPKYQVFGEGSVPVCGEGEGHGGIRLGIGKCL